MTICGFQNHGKEIGLACPPGRGGGGGSAPSCFVNKLYYIAIRAS